MERKLASIQVIHDLQPIPGADAILCAKVLGWELVVKKTEFQVGDKCVFFEIDAIIPNQPWSAHLCRDGKPLRVRTIRLRKQLSQGVALPITLLPPGDYAEGQDVTLEAGVTKWEPQIPPELQGKVKGTRPSWIPKTDEPRLQSDPDALQELLSLGCDIVGTVKMDGSSVTAYLKDGVFGVTSRNMELIETEDNAYWKTVRKNNVEQKMRLWFENKNVALQGELVGPGIQGNRAGLTELDIHWFNLFNIDTSVYLSTEELYHFTQKTQLEMVAIIFSGELPHGTNVVSLLKIANDLNYSNGLPAEGIVWRPVEETYSNTLKGRLSVKTISNRFLELYKE